MQRIFWTEAEVNERLESVLARTFAEVTDMAARLSMTNRMAAMAIGVERVRAGKQLRGLFP